jgi:hypothetical protein
MKKIVIEIPGRFSVGNRDSVIWIERVVQTTFCWAL